MKYQYELHKKEKAYDGFFKFNRFLVSFEKFTGGKVENVWRECNQKGDVVAVIPYDPVRQEIIFVEQFRIGMLVRKEHPWTLEIVAGFMDIDGETAPETAKREVFEETGCEVTQLHPLISYYHSPGGSAGKTHIFIGEVDAHTVQKYTGIIEEGEDICVHRIPVAMVKEKLLNNEINNSTAIISLQRFFMENWIERLAPQH